MSWLPMTGSTLALGKRSLMAAVRSLSADSTYSMEGGAGFRQCGDESPVHWKEGGGDLGRRRGTMK